MWYRFLLSGLLVLICFSLQAQSGSYFLAHYAPPDERIDFRSKSMTQDTQGETYFATRAGVLVFDGLKWKLVRVPGSVYTLSTQGNIIFAGGLMGAGKLTDKNTGSRKYQELSHTEGIFSSTIHHEQVYFCSAEEIQIYSVNDQSTPTTIRVPQKDAHFLGLYKIGEDIIVRADSSRLYKIQNGSLVDFKFPVSNLLFTRTLQSQSTELIGTQDNRVYISREGNLQELILEDNQFLDHNILVDGAWLNSETIVLGTLRAGVIFVNTKTGATEQLINYSSGLPDNEVFSLMADTQGGIWVAHEYGFTRIMPSMPFRSFSQYRGLDGNLLCVESFAGSVYVGTSLGLYKLVGNKNTESLLQSKNNTSKSDSSDKKNLESFEFQRIEPIEGKVTQLVQIEGELYASGAGGVFKLEDNRAQQVIDKPVHYLYYSTSMNQVFVANFDNHVQTFEIHNQGWNETHLLDDLNSYITHIFEDRLKSIWLCGGTDIFKIETLDGQIDDILKFPIQNPMLDETMGFALGNQPYIVSSGQFKRFNGTGFENYDSLASGGKYFASAGNFWFHDGNSWRSVSRNAGNLKLEWLNVFEGLRFLSFDNTSKDALWVITDKNELFKFINTGASPKQKSYPLFLREVRGNEISLARNLEIDQSKGSVSFEFIRPDYVGVPITQYRYHIKGLSKQWSNWSPTNNVIDFSYLPAGKYVLEVQSKDLLGEESNIEQISFKVQLPYWKRWWFYALEFVVFSLLVIISIRLARSNSRFRFLSEILTILTVIMLIQFIQTVVISMLGIQTSPVLDFFVQVSIALMIFPVEIVARKGMQKIIRQRSGFLRPFDAFRE